MGEKYTELSLGQKFVFEFFASIFETSFLQPILYMANMRAQSRPATIDIRHLYRGSIASFLSSSLPMDVIIVQQQIHGGSTSETIKRVLSNYKLSKGLFRGFVPGMLSESILYLSSAYIYLNLTGSSSPDSTNSSSPNQPTKQVFSCILSGLLAAGLSQPLEVIRLSMQGDLEQTNYTTIRQTTRQLWTEGGLPRLYKGFVWRSLRANTILCLNMFIYDTYKGQLKRYMDI